MRNLIIFVCSFLLAAVTFGQEKTALLQVVEAEKNFAADASSIGITEAFLKHMDDSALVFERGQILNGKDVWKSRKTDSMELKWYPEFAGVASSGDFGYTTGPSEFRVTKGSEKPDHKGYFNSIWKKNAAGEWKVVLDMGTPSPQSEFNEHHVEYTEGKPVVSARKKEKSKNATDDIKMVEEKFIAEYAGGGDVKKYASPAVRYYRPGQKVAKGAYAVGDTVILKYRNAGTGVANSGDLAYAYGYVDVPGRTGNYLRVWKKDSDAWRIVLDAATY